MYNRREFIKKASGAIALVGFHSLALALRFASNAIPQPGVQLFTYFNFLDNDVEGTLKKVAETGVRNIESAFQQKRRLLRIDREDIIRAAQKFGDDVEISSRVWSSC